MTREIKPLVPVSQEGWEDVARGLLGPQKGNGGKGVSPVRFPSTANRADYIQIPRYNIVIARTESFKGLDAYDQIEQLKIASLRAPKIVEFMAHCLNVRDASEGKTKLFDAAGNSLSKADAVDLWKYLSSGHRGGCWTLLNAFFQPCSQGGLEMLTDLRVVWSGSNKSFAGTPLRLDGSYLHEDAYVDLSFNSQGLPTIKAAKQKYKQSKDIYFWEPRQNCVAGFDADSGGALLDCGRDPQIHNPQLGVFACAEGTAAKN